MRLHITHDDKFIDYFIENAASLGYCDDKYVIYTESGHLKYVTSKMVDVVTLNSSKYSEIINNMSNYESVFIHFLSPTLFDFILTIPNEVKLAWVFWGGDAFEHPRIRKNYYKPLTADYFNNKLDVNRWSYKFILTRLLDKFRDRDYEILPGKWERCMRRFDYFCHYIFDDWIDIRNIFGLNARYIEFNYGSWNQVTMGNYEIVDQSDKFNILLGNSADIANNHIDIMDALSRTNISANQKIYVPLSYASPSDNYNKHVIEYGNRKFGDMFIPLNTFINRHDYNKILDSCGFCIMDHIRSQAFGNILHAFANGKKVFMSKNSNLYRHLIAQSFIVNTTEHDLLKTYSLSDRLSLEQKKSNFANLDRHYGHDTVLKRYRNVLELQT